MALVKGGERTCSLRNWANKHPPKQAQEQRSLRDRGRTCSLRNQANEHLVELAPEGMRLMSIGANGVGEEPTLH